MQRIERISSILFGREFAICRAVPPAVDLVSVYINV